MRKDVIVLVFAVMVPLVLACLVPRDALRPLTGTHDSSRPFCSFVTLTPDAEREAIRSTRTSWQMHAGSERRLHAELISQELPSVPLHAVGDRRRDFRVDAPIPMPPVSHVERMTLAAPPPVTIRPQDGADDRGATFSRDELLKLR